MGSVYLIGAGPGAADLITIRAANILAGADVVFYDALVNPEILDLYCPQAQQICVGKRAGRHAVDQRFISKHLVSAAQRHANVVRLKGGDPMLFGRAQEEIDSLEAAGIDYQIIPGVTAALAASAELRVPLTRRGISRSVTFVTPRSAGKRRSHDWLAPVLTSDTSVLYMGLGEAETITHRLLACGMSPQTPIAIVENASLPACRTLSGLLCDLPALASQTDFQGPATLLIGEVLRDLVSVPAASPAQAEEALDDQAT